MALSRRSVLRSSAALAGAWSFNINTRPARAAEFSYKYGGNLPAQHPTMMWAQEAANRIQAQTGGRLEIKIFPSNQLGSDTDMLSQLRSGALKFFTLAGTDRQPVITHPLTETRFCC